MYNSPIMPNSLSGTKLATREYLLDYIDQKQTRASNISQSFGELWRTIYDLASAPGKYIRPQLVVLSAQAHNQDLLIEDIIPAAASVELLHLAVLIHDDIIDRDDVRKGIPNISGRYLDNYAPYIGSESELRHFASSAALLAGDALLSSSHHVLSLANIRPELLRLAIDLMSDATFRVIGGELMDTETAVYGASSSQPLLIAVEKTSSYSFCMPLALGATLGGASEQDIELLDNIGTEMGIVFQLRDDELGVFGDSDLIGKPVDSDIREGKFTYMVAQHRKLATDAQNVEFDLGFGKLDAKDEDIESSRQALIASGARQASTERMQLSQASAVELIGKLSWPESSKGYLLDLLRKSAERSK